MLAEHARWLEEFFIRYNSNWCEPCQWVSCLSRTNNVLYTSSAQLFTKIQYLIVRILEKSKSASLHPTNNISDEISTFSLHFVHVLLKKTWFYPFTSCECCISLLLISNSRRIEKLMLSSKRVAQQRSARRAGCCADRRCGLLRELEHLKQQLGRFINENKSFAELHRISVNGEAFGQIYSWLVWHWQFKCQGSQPTLNWNFWLLSESHFAFSLTHSPWPYLKLADFALE